VIAHLRQADVDAIIGEHNLLAKNLLVSSSHLPDFSDFVFNETNRVLRINTVQSNHEFERV
jgi:hypothetical protein